MQDKPEEKARPRRCEHGNEPKSCPEDECVVRRIVES
jgi:hypothetical protein